MRAIARAALRIVSVIATVAVTLFVLNLQATAADVAASQAHEMVNASRASAGVGPVSSDPRLASIAQNQAQRMSEQGQIFHNPAIRADMDASGMAWQRYGENVGVGPDVAEVHSAFMMSTDHRHNILEGRFNALGIGVVVNGDRIYVAQVFATCATSYVTAEDGSRVPRSFYGVAC